jgi:eukaryotic-like serine/threonine-protein kinase
MSRVWVATERKLDRRVVVKVLPPQVAEIVAADRFAREVRLTARLQHPNIVPVLTVGVLAGALRLPYYTMPYISGESLRAALADTPRLAISRVISILRDIARALAFAHGEGIIHRDIKPENILLASDAAVVTDFGIAKAVADTRSETAVTADQMLTGLGQILGTPQYMAPEQIIADPSVDHRADIYSFGIVAYELLAGRRPFAEGDLRHDFTARLTGRASHVRTLRPDTPDGIATLVMKCLEAKPEARPQRMTDVLVALDATEPNLPRLRRLRDMMRLPPRKA